MRNTFQRELEALQAELIKLGNLCETAISMALKGLLDQDGSLIDNVFTVDREIDKKEREVERMSLHLLLTQQPVAGDLRMTSAALKMVSDMERIGDQASDIADIARHMTGASLPQTCIPAMGQAAITMVTESIDAFVKNDLESFQEELAELIQRDSAQGKAYIDLLMIAKYLERIGDHATNIAEWVEYSLTGLYKGDKL